MSVISSEPILAEFGKILVQYLDEPNTASAGGPTLGGVAGVDGAKAVYLVEKMHLLAKLIASFVVEQRKTLTIPESTRICREIDLFVRCGDTDTALRMYDRRDGREVLFSNLVELNYRVTPNNATLLTLKVAGVPAEFTAGRTITVSGDEEDLKDWKIA